MTNNNPARIDINGSLKKGVLSTRFQVPLQINIIPIAPSKVNVIR